MPPLVHIGIITYNSIDCIERCLASVAQQTWPEIRVTVLDNSSSDGTAQWLKRHTKKYDLLLKSINMGFSVGHNTMIVRHESDYYLPLNPDVELTPNYVEQMVACCEADPSVGWVSGKVLFPKTQDDACCKIYSAGHAVFTNGRFTNIGYGEMDNGQYDEPREIFGANGAAPLYRTAMLNDIALPRRQFYDELFFLYGTDTDLDWRARLRSWTCRYVPTAVAYHDAQGSGGLKDRAIRIDYIRRRYIFLLKNMFLMPLLSYYLGLIYGDYRMAKKDGNMETVEAVKTIRSFLPEVWRKRQSMMRRKNRSKQELLKWMLPSEKHTLDEL